jgi:hypothetical protein
MPESQSRHKEILASVGARTRRGCSSAFRSHGVQDGSAIRRAWLLCHSNEVHDRPVMSRQDNLLAAFRTPDEFGEQALRIAYRYVHRE